MQLRIENWTIGQIMRLLDLDNLTVWFKPTQSSVNASTNIDPGKVRNAKESGIIEVISSGLRLRPLNVIENKPQRYYAFDSDNIIHYLYTIQHSELFSKADGEFQAKFENTVLSINIYSDVSEDEKFFLAQSDLV